MLAGRSVVSIACGSQHSTACTADGRLFSWGLNASGQLGRRPAACSPHGAAAALKGRYLGRNEIGDEGAKQLAEALRARPGFSRLSKLFLDGNSVGEAGSDALPGDTGGPLEFLLVYREALRQAPAGFSAATKCFCTEHQQVINR